MRLTQEGALAVREFLVDCGVDGAPIWDDFQTRCPHPSTTNDVCDVCYLTLPERCPICGEPNAKHDDYACRAEYEG